MIDKEKTCKEFKKIIKNKSGVIAIYGLGEYAKILAQSMLGEIFCFCDGRKQDGIFEGKPILPLTVLPNKGIRTIVIAAGRKAEEKIYERICQFCKQNGILMYGIQSGSLNEVGDNLSDNLAGQEAKKKLWEDIKSHEVISFDIFDTLLMRKTLYPTDVFDIVEYRAGRAGITLLPGFRNYRHQAEVAVERKKRGLSGIYDNLRNMLGLSVTDTESLMQIEMEVEREVVLPRQEVVEAGKFAKSLGKKVVLVSDMYLPPSFMERLLAENGIDFYDKLYVSDFCGTSKVQELFRLVRAENPASGYLHIGDNPEADGWGARKHGIDYFYVASGLNMFRSTGLSQPFKYIDGINDRLLLGMFIARAFASPFCIDQNGKRKIDSCADFAELFIAPLATSFVMWLLTRVKGRGFAGILFAARDGYLFQKMYDKAIMKWHLDDMPTAKYLYVSRKLSLGLAVRTVPDLEWVRSKIQGGTKKFFNDVFNLNLTSHCEMDDESTWQEILKVKEEIIGKSKERCSQYKVYLNKNEIDCQYHYAFVDLCSQGTSQRALVKEVLPNLHGLYFKRYDSKDIETMGIVESFLPEDNEMMLLNNVFEFIFTSPEPSAYSVNNDGNILFSNESRRKEEIKECFLAQIEIMDFFDDYVKLALPGENINRTVGQQLLELYRGHVFSNSIKVFKNRAISNDLAGGRIPV